MTKFGILKSLWYSRRARGLYCWTSPPPNKPLLFSSIGAIYARLRRACRASRDTRVAREYAWNEKKIWRSFVGIPSVQRHSATDVRLTRIDSFALASVRYESHENSTVRRAESRNEIWNLKMRQSDSLNIKSISNVRKFYLILFQLIFKILLFSVENNFQTFI